MDALTLRALVFGAQSRQPCFFEFSRMSQGLYYGLVSVVMSFLGNDMV